MEAGELSSILMRIIRTLSESDSGQQREDQKRRLQQQWKESDSAVDRLVFKKQRELTQVMQVYARVSNRLARARARVAEIKAGLSACKELLHYKRDDLKKHWLEGVQQKHMLELMEGIQMMKQTPEKFDTHLSEQNHLAATRLLVEAMGRLSGDLKEIGGLSEIRTLVEKRRDKLYTTLMENLGWLLYHGLETDSQRGGAGGGAGHRGGSSNNSGRGRGGGGGGSRGGSRGGSGREKGSSNEAGGGGTTFSQQHLLRTLQNRNLHDTKDKAILLEDVELEDFLSLTVVEKNSRCSSSSDSNSASSRAHRIVVTVECLHLLQKLGDAVETLRQDQLAELQNIIQRSTVGVRDGAAKGFTGNALSALFASVVEQFTMVAQGCHLVGRTMVKLASRESSWCQAKLEQAEVWAKVQTAVQEMLVSYLDFDNKLSIHQPTKAQFSEPTQDINSYFVRRKNVRGGATMSGPKKPSLFRFNASSTGISLSEAEATKSIKDAAGGGKGGAANNPAAELVCPPNPHNVTLIYSCLMDFISSVESSLKLDPGKHCALYGFLMDYIKDVFLGQIHADNGDTLNEASHLLDAWKTITDLEVLRDHRATRPLLQSAVVVRKAIEDLFRYMQDLPLYREHFLTMVCQSVMQYKEICLAAYRGLVQPDSEDKRIISAQWARDEQLGKTLKEMPGWIELRGNPDAVAALPANLGPEQRAAKETTLVRSKIGQYQISQHEILSDSNQLRSLGLLQESMEWFSSGVTAMAQKLHRSNEVVGLISTPKLSTNSIQTLVSHAKELEGIADTCLLILHLEVRLHCLFYLTPLRSGPSGAHFNGGPDSTDPSQEVVRLNSDLLAVEEVLSASLDESKVSYAFEGVSHLVATLLIDCISNIRKVNKFGVKKMCRNVFSAQHTIASNVTGSRENSLDMAKQYYEMLNLRPQEVLNEIVEKGPVFSHDQYLRVLELLHRSDPDSTPEAHKKYAAKLAEIVKRMGVAV